MMAAFSDLCIASGENEDVSDTTLEKLLGLFNGQFEECLSFVDASLRVFIPRLADTIKKCEEDLNREKDTSLKREKEWGETAREMEVQKNEWGVKAKQWREKIKQMNDSLAEKEGLLNDEMAKRRKLEEEVENLAAHLKKEKSNGDILHESLAEYKSMGVELNGVMQELDKKDAKILSLQKQLEDNVSLVKPGCGSKRPTKDVAHTSEPFGFIRPPPMLEKRENPVLAESSPSKSCPPLKRPKIVIPETIGFGDDSVGLKRQSLNRRDGDRQCEYPSEQQQRKQANALAQKDRPKEKPPSRKSSLMLSTECTDSDEEEITPGATSEHQPRTNKPSLPQLPPTVQSSHQPKVEVALPSQSQPLSEEDENQVSSSPLVEKKSKLKSKLASKKRRKLVEEQSSANSVSSLSSLSEPWLSCNSGTKRSQNDGTNQSPAGPKKTAPTVTATSSLSNWDPKDGKRQATVTQLFDPGNVSERAKKDQQIREREEEELRIAMQESLKMAKTQCVGSQLTEKPSATAISTTTSFLDATMIDPDLAEVHQTAGVSETQALNLINSPAECTARRFSKARGFATKSQLSKNQPKQVIPANSRSSEIGSHSSKASSPGLTIESIESGSSTLEVLSVIPPKAPITSAASLITDSPFLQTVTGSSDAFVTPAKKNVRRKKRKATPNPQLDEIFGESDAESDVSFITPPKVMTAMTTSTTTASTMASCSTNRVAPPSDQPTSSEPQDPHNSSLNDSAFLTFSQVKRGKDEERRKVVSEQGGVSHKSKNFREELKRTACEKCGKDYLTLGFSAEEANKKIWEKCPHGRGRDAENRCETPPHLWNLGPMKKKWREEEERSRNANQEGVGPKRPRRKKPLGFGSSSPKEDD